MKKTASMIAVLSLSFITSSALAQQHTSFFAHKKKSTAISVPDVNSFNNKVADNQKCVAAGQTSCNGEDMSRFYAGGDPTNSRQSIKESLSTNNVWAPPKQPEYLPQIPSTATQDEATQPFYSQNQNETNNQQAKQPTTSSRTTSSGMLFPTPTDSSGSGSNSSGGSDFIVH